jgi:hypothetical protein
MIPGLKYTALELVLLPSACLLLKCMCIHGLALLHLQMHYIGFDWPHWLSHVDLGLTVGLPRRASFRTDWAISRAPLCLLNGRSDDGDVPCRKPLSGTTEWAIMSPLYLLRPKQASN